MKKKVLNQNTKAGSRESNEPRLLGSILIEMLHSDEPLAEAFRKRMAAEKADEEYDETSQLFEDIFPQTELDIDLKLFTNKPRRVRTGEFLAGLLTRDGEDHYCFVQNVSEKKRVVKQRNLHIYKGSCVNVIRKENGTLSLAFNRPRFTEDFTFKHFCLKAAEELLTVVGLVEE